MKGKIPRVKNDWSGRRIVRNFRVIPTKRGNYHTYLVRNAAAKDTNNYELPVVRNKSKVEDVV